jgi:hypothetical protein
MNQKIIVTLLLITSTSVLSQNLLKERIRSIPSDKKAIFLDQGIFHKNEGEKNSVLTATRHSYKKSQGFERFVFDFETKTVPKTYIYAAGHNKRFFIDFFDTTLGDSIQSLGNSKFLKVIDYFPISKNQLSLELAFKKPVSVDLFYLEGGNKKARLVLDVKE